MNQPYLPKFILGAWMLLSMTSGFAGSDRWIMVMTDQRMIQEDLVFVKFLAADGIQLESDALKQMVIRKADCDTGRTLEMIIDYKMGYEPKKMQVGIYLYPRSWTPQPLCFSVPQLGKIQQQLDPADNHGRIFQLKMIQ